MSVMSFSSQRFRGGEGRWIKGQISGYGTMLVLGVGEVRAITVGVVCVSSHGSGYGPLHLGAVTEASSSPLSRDDEPRRMLSRVAN